MSVVVLGGINEDVVIDVAALPHPGETLLAHGVSRSAGGKGLNQAVAAARFGAATRLLGAVGNDDAGRFLRGVMEDAGVDQSAVLTRRDHASGRAFICLAADGSNTVIVDAAANVAFGAEDVRNGLSSARVSLTQFEATYEAIAALFALPEAGLRILNAAPALTARRDLIACADILIVNETECMAFADVSALPTEVGALAQVARSLFDGDLAHIVVTLGAKGCVLVDRQGHHAFPGMVVPVVDTVGAGDCFCGVTAAALAEGMDLAQALRFASAAAALSVSRRGAASSSPTRADVEAFIEAMREQGRLGAWS